MDTHSRRAMIAAIFSGSVTLVVALLSGGGEISFGSFGLWNLVDAALMYAFAWGFYRRNWISAIFGLVYLAWSKTLLWWEFQKVGALLGLAVIGYFFVQGARAAFATRRGTPVSPGPPAV